MLTVPLSFRWADLVDGLVLERGSLAELVRVLYEIHPGELPEDPLTVERGIRRLRKREGQSGDKYGRMLIRHFGLPLSVQTWARELGQYHSRLSELPTALRRDQLRLWDRPPLSESAQAAWIHLALASLAHRDGDQPGLARRLELAALGVKRAGVAAEIELGLFRARLATDAGEPARAELLLEQVQPLTHAHSISARDRACTSARRLDQLAYLRSRDWRSAPQRLELAQALYEQIPGTGYPFVVFRRHQGLAWCLWRQGREGALEHAQLAAQAAGDGGFLHLRCISLRLQAKLLGPGPAAAHLRARIERIEAALDHDPRVASAPADPPD